MDAQALGQERLELPPGEALVREGHLTGADKVVVAFQQCGHHLPFAELGVRQAPGHWHAFGGGQQIEPEAQKKREWLRQ